MVVNGLSQVGSACFFLAYGPNGQGIIGCWSVNKPGQVGPEEKTPAYDLAHGQ